MSQIYLITDKNKWNNDTSNTQSYKQIPSTKDLQVKQLRSYERVASDWKDKVPNVDTEDQLMQENMEESEIHQDPHLYVSHSIRSGWETSTALNKEPYLISSSLYHSSSNSNLKYKKTNTNVMNYSKDKTSSSTSYINATRHLDRAKPTPSIALDLNSEIEEGGK